MTLFGRTFLVPAFALALLAGGQPASADPIVEAGDTIKFSDGPGTTGGGEFIATVNGTWSFLTFCLQMTEYINFSSTFTVDAVTTYAISDPASRGGDAAGHDPLDDRTAWLYTQFRAGTLQGYDYAGTLAERSASADLLQNAIWMIEQEKTMDASQYYVDLANQALANGWTGTGDVVVLNLERLVNGQWVESQDQLALVPVPEPGTLLLMGLGTALILGRSRRATWGPESVS